MEDVHPLFTLALVLTAGLIGGELVSRIKLPRVTGWIITGILVRPLGLPGLEEETLKGFSPLTDFILGYIAFTVGSHLNLKQLRNAGKRLFLLVLTEATITPLVVAAAMYYIGGFPVEIALIFAAIAVAGAPGTTMLVVREARARGVFAKTLIAAVALIDMVAVVLFVLIDTELGTGTSIEGPGFLLTALPEALAALGIAAGIGLGVALFVIVLTRAVVGAKLLGASLLAAIIISWGVADALDVSSILACTFVGVALSNLMADKERIGEAYLNTFGDLLFTIFYTLAGLRLDFSNVIPMAGMIALYFGARSLGKYLSAFTAMSLAGAVKSVRNYLGIALIPHGGVAVGLILFTQDDPNLAGWADAILAIGLAALAINQLVGPSATKIALGIAGEAGRDRPRLLDFLHEEHIVTGFAADSKEDAIRQLTDVLYGTNDLEMDKSEFLKLTLEHDAEESTCLGEGLMIPHGPMTAESDNAVLGVMGISRVGLDFDTPDGRPVHAVVLLATPVGARDRHLEVLAAFAKAIGGDRNVREQLYKARSAAHAYYILHAEEAEDFNYFLEEQLADDARE